MASILKSASMLQNANNGYAEKVKDPGVMVTLGARLSGLLPSSLRAKNKLLS